MKIPVMLTIGGSDSSGGAGIQADCAAARSENVFPVCAISCITSQDHDGIRMMQPVDVHLFVDQILAAFQDFSPDAVKIGMLPTERHIKEVISILRALKPNNVVLDPIMAPTKTNENTSQFCQEMWRDPELLLEISPLIDLVTPNIPEAMRLLQIKEYDDAMQLTLQFLRYFTPKGVLLKGGHGKINSHGDIEDILALKNGIVLSIRHPWVDTRNTHGTGCSLSSLIAAQLAKGRNMEEAVTAASRRLDGFLSANRGSEFHNATTIRQHPHGPTLFEPGNISEIDFINHPFTLS